MRSIVGTALAGGLAFAAALAGEAVSRPAVAQTGQGAACRDVQRCTHVEYSRYFCRTIQVCGERPRPNSERYRDNGPGRDDGPGRGGGGMGRP